MFLENSFFLIFFQLNKPVYENYVSFDALVLLTYLSLLTLQFKIYFSCLYVPISVGTAGPNWLNKMNLTPGQWSPLLYYRPVMSYPKIVSNQI